MKVEKTVKTKVKRPRQDKKRSFEFKMITIERDRKRRDKYSQG